MAKLMDMVRNSPLLQKKSSGGYAVLESENKDPFIKGIPFTVYYCASAEVQDQTNSPAVQETVRELYESSKVFRKAILTVRSHCLAVTDVATKMTDSYPIFLVAYCGGHAETKDSFYFIHKTKLDKTLRVEVFRCSNPEKVKAITITIAKAFNISYKAWMIEKKKREKEKASKAKLNGSESPALARKNLPPTGKSSNLTKIAPGIATGGTHTPPAPRKPNQEMEPVGRTRSGSFGDKPAPSRMQNPAVVRAMTHNETTGSTHNVTLTDDFDKEFQELAELRSQPEVLRTSFSEETDHFNFDDIKAHINADD